MTRALRRPCIVSSSLEFCTPEVRIDFHCAEPEAGTARNEKSGRTLLALIEPFVRGSSSNSQRQAVTFGRSSRVIVDDLHVPTASSKLHRQRAAKGHDLKNGKRSLLV